MLTRERTKNLTCKVVDSIVKIKKEDWDSVFGDIPEGNGFYRTLEQSCLEEFEFYYALIYQGAKLVLIAPMFTADFNLDIATNGRIEKFIRRIRKRIPRLFVLKTLFCGSPFGEKGVLGFSRDVTDKSALILELAKSMEEFSRHKNIPLIIFKDFLKFETTPLDSLQNIGFFKVKSFPSTVSELNFNNFDQYLYSLGHSTRKSLRKKLEQAYSTADIKIEVRDRVDDMVDDIYRLYSSTYQCGLTKFERLTKEFFIAAGNNLYPHIKFFLYYCNGKLAAFNLCFVYEDLFIDKFIGFDYDISHKFNLYYVSWCFNIDWCLKNSLRLYQTGQTDYLAKVRLGGRLVNLYAYIRHSNPMINFIFKGLAKVLKPENFDHDIRNSSDV